MNFKMVLGSGAVIGAVAFFSSFNLTSCTKTTTVHDTTIVTVRDTIIKTETDTIIQIDTVCKLQLGLVAHYNFTNGSLLDLTDNHNDIVFNSATPTADVKGEANNAYLFNGTDNYMRVPNSPSLNPQRITLMARIKINGFYQGTCHANEIIGKGSPDYAEGFYVLRITDPYGFCYNLPDETKEFFAGGYGDNNPEGSAAGVAADTAYLQKDKWYTAVFTYDGTQSKMYVNGKLKAVQSKTTTFNANHQDLYIGRHEDPNFPYLFNGVIDEIRIYDRAVNAKEAEILSIP